MGNQINIKLICSLMLVSVSTIWIIGKPNIVMAENDNFTFEPMTSLESPQEVTSSSDPVLKNINNDLLTNDSIRGIQTSPLDTENLMVTQEIGSVRITAPKVRRYNNRTYLTPASFNHTTGDESSYIHTILSGSSTVLGINPDNQVLSSRPALFFKIKNGDKDVYSESSSSVDQQGNIIKEGQENGQSDYSLISYNTGIMQPKFEVKGLDIPANAHVYNIYVGIITTIGPKSFITLQKQYFQMMKLDLIPKVNEIKTGTKEISGTANQKGDQISIQIWDKEKDVTNEYLDSVKVMSSKDDGTWKYELKKKLAKELMVKIIEKDNDGDDAPASPVVSVPVDGVPSTENPNQPQPPKLPTPPTIASIGALDFGTIPLQANPIVHKTFQNWTMKINNQDKQPWHVTAQTNNNQDFAVMYNSISLTNNPKRIASSSNGENNLIKTSGFSIEFDLRNLKYNQMYSKQVKLTLVTGP